MVRSTREKHRGGEPLRARVKNRSRATARVKKTIRGGALRCCWLAAKIVPVPRKRGLMIEPAPLIYALRHTLHRGFVFRDRLVNKIFCNSRLRHFASLLLPRRSCRSFVLLSKTAVNRLSREITFRVYPSPSGQRREATRGTARNRRGRRAEVTEEERTALPYGHRTITLAFAKSIFHLQINDLDSEFR